MTFCPVVAVPTTFATVRASVEGLYVNVVSVETAIPLTKPFCGENKIKWLEEVEAVTAETLVAVVAKPEAAVTSSVNAIVLAVPAPIPTLILL